MCVCVCVYACVCFLEKVCVLGAGSTKYGKLGETLITGIGQGYILATPMQICKSMAEFANGGYKVNPTFYLDEKSKLSRMDFDAENIKIINEALVAATNEPGGTSYGSRLSGKLKFAGKTGTSQVTKLTVKDREDNANPNSREYKYRKKTH